MSSIRYVTKEASFSWKEFTLDVVFSLVLLFGNRVSFNALLSLLKVIVNPMSGVIAQDVTDRSNLLFFIFFFLMRIFRFTIVLSPFCMRLSNLPCHIRTIFPIKLWAFKITVIPMCYAYLFRWWYKKVFSGSKIFFSGFWGKCLALFYFIIYIMNEFNYYPLSITPIIVVVED